MFKRFCENSTKSRITYFIIIVTIKSRSDSNSKTQYFDLIIYLKKLIIIISVYLFIHLFIFLCLGFLSQTFTQGKAEGISLTPLYHFHPLHRHLEIDRAITAEGSPLHTASSRTRTGNLCFSRASC